VSSITVNLFPRDPVFNGAVADSLTGFIISVNIDENFSSGVVG
jgi:hypothetical protein